MNPIEKIKKEVLEELKENYDNSIYEPILLFEGGDIAIELAIKLTAKEIFEEIEKEKQRYKKRFKGWTAEIIEGLEIAQKITERFKKS